MKINASRVLLVEDDPDDSFFTDRALKKVLSPASAVLVLSSGEEAIHYLAGEGKYSDRATFPFPTIVITDLNMPDGDGFTILEFLQGNVAWSVVPRIMFSSSDDEDDIRTSFLLGASAYHLKPIFGISREQCMRAIVEYWSSSEIPSVDVHGRILTTSCTGRLGARYPQPKGSETMSRPTRIPARI
jgi:CheY-like chemotaxis protein